MHFWKDEAGWHYLSAEGYKERKTNLPSVVFVIKYPIKDIPSRNWPEISKDIFTEEDRASNHYISNCKVDDKNLPELEISESSILNRGPYDFDPLIFIKCSKNLKKDSILPRINLLDYYELTENKGVYVEVQPNYIYEKN